MTRVSFVRRALVVLGSIVAAGCTFDPLTPLGGDFVQPGNAAPDKSGVTSRRPPPPPVPLMWTADIQHWYAGNWDGGMAAAAAHVEGGYDDWRLPTVAELQAALQDGSWGCGANPGGSFTHWTSQSQGTSAWAVTIVKDDSGCPIPELSGEANRYLKGSNFWGARFVRP